MIATEFHQFDEITHHTAVFLININESEWTQTSSDRRNFAKYQIQRFCDSLSFGKEVTIKYRKCDTHIIFMVNHLIGFAINE
ncbi:hypothetical protein NYV52_14580 [Escherichia coli]|nr:hypothetical protein [Escherichia coli]